VKKKEKLGMVVSHFARARAGTRSIFFLKEEGEEDGGNLFEERQAVTGDWRGRWGGFVNSGGVYGGVSTGGICRQRVAAVVALAVADNGGGTRSVMEQAEGIVRVRWQLVVADGGGDLG
jgi:hypothetical protein